MQAGVSLLYHMYCVKNCPTASLNWFLAALCAHAVSSTQAGAYFGTVYVCTQLQPCWLQKRHKPVLFCCQHGMVSCF
jgi:hypothetical protein